MQEENKIVLFNSEFSKNKIELIHEEGDIWASQKQMSEMFGVSTTAINQHIQHRYKTGEFDKNSTCKYSQQVQIEGKRTIKRNVLIYNLKVIISVGYGVDSYKATKFKDWATEIIKDFATKGIAINEKLLVSDSKLLANATKNLYMLKGDVQSLTKMCADIMSLSIDYEKSSPYATEFYIKVNAKLCYAVTNNTPSEVKYYRADGYKPNMNATAFKGDKITKSEAKSARSYLTEQEYDFFCTLVASLYNKCKIETMRGEKFYMADWLNKIDELLLFHKFPILNHGGKVTALIADKHIDTQYKILNRKSITD